MGGDISFIFARYQELMIAREFGSDDYRSEEMHRSSMHISILADLALVPYAEYKRMKVKLQDCKPVNAN